VSLQRIQRTRVHSNTSIGSHPNDEDAHFRMSEEQIYTSIFAYVDHLFGKIKPKKLFFMAVDGVAPRAKMNQQRSRRFRTAKEAREVREKAERKGEKLPEEKAFDSNCITPGVFFFLPQSAEFARGRSPGARNARYPFHGEALRAAALFRE
jgi:5'-3' exonuclease